VVASNLNVLSDEKFAELDGYRGNGKATPKPAEQPKKKPLFELMESVTEEEIDCLWAGRIPRGKLSIFDGDAGIGKSTVALAIAAVLSKGAALPFDKEPESPLRSWIISAEDGAADTIKPRLRKLGADMNLIAIPNRDLNLTPSQVNAVMIDQMLREFPAAFMVIDPILAYANRRNTDKASDVRDLLQPLVSVADKHKTAIVMIRHLNKGTQVKALYRGQGSVDFGAIVRSAFIFAKDADNDERRMMAHYKCSFGAEKPTLEYFIDKDTGAFRWGAETSESPDEALGTGEPRKERESHELDGAKRFLENFLSQGPKPSNDIKAKSRDAGISNATLWRAKEHLDVRASKERGTGEWWWRLP
jgi:RecA-family ATPase